MWNRFLIFLLFFDCLIMLTTYDTYDDKHLSYLTLNSGLSWILEKLLEAYLQVSRLVRHCASHRAVVHVHTTSTLCIALCSCAQNIHIVQLCTLHQHCAHYVDIVHRRSTKCAKCVHLACDCFKSFQNKTLMLIDLNQESTNQVDLRVTFC